MIAPAHPEQERFHQAWQGEPISPRLFNEMTVKQFLQSATSCRKICPSDSSGRVQPDVRPRVLGYTSEQPLGGFAQFSIRARKCRHYAWRSVDLFKWLTRKRQSISEVTDLPGFSVT